MGTKKQKGSVSIEHVAGRIRLRWRYQTQRYSLNLSSFSKANMAEAKKTALLIERDVLCNTMDITLAKYTFRIIKEEKPVQTVVELFEQWVKDYKQMDCNVNSDYHQIRNMLRRWSNVEESKLLSLLNNADFSPKTYNGRLAILKKFTSWLYKNKVWKLDPLEDVSTRKKKKVERSDRKPFTVEEISSILEAVRTNKFSKKSSRYPHSFYYPFIYFLFKTGVRNSEAVGLRAGSVDFSKGVVVIKEALSRTVNGTHASARKRKETKTGVVRQLPLTKDLSEVLKPLVVGKDTDELVFTSFTGTAIDDRAFQKRVFKPVLKQLGIPERVLYACRHTFGSRCINEGITPVMTAFLMGNHPETALRNYTHQISLPNVLPDIL